MYFENRMNTILPGESVEQVAKAFFTGTRDCHGYQLGDMIFVDDQNPHGTGILEVAVVDQKRQVQIDSITVGWCKTEQEVLDYFKACLKPDVETFRKNITVPMNNGAIITVLFLDYEIVNSGNGDGWVLTKNSKTPGYQSYECHLGNFSTVEDAKEYSIRQFMIHRPETFSQTVCNKMVRTGSGTMHEWFLLKREAGHLPGFTEIHSSCDMNSMITFNGKII